MIPRQLNNKSGYQFDLQGEVPSIVLNDSGDILTCDPTKYISLSGGYVSGIIPSTVSDGINLILESECPTIISPFQYAHLEFVLSYNANFVKDGASESDVLYRFESLDPDGWFVELDSTYDFPGTGYTSTYAAYRYRVKYVATGLDLNLSNKIYFYYRARYVSLVLGDIYLSNTYSSYVGKILDMRESYYSNTGSHQTNQIVVNLATAISDYWSYPWPVGKNINYEIYIGKYGNHDTYEATGDYEEYRDSSIDPAGFYYFNGLSNVGFGENGMPGVNGGNKITYLTDELDVEKALFAVYRAKWAGGQTGWISQSLKLVDYVSDDPDKTFFPSSEITIRANTFNDRYHVHVIVGTSPNLVDYFDEEETNDFADLSIYFPGLIEYSYTGNSTDRSKFYYYSNESVKNVGSNGFNNTIDNRITYISATNYSGEDKLYVFWRFQYESGTPSSSASDSSISSSNSSDSMSSTSGFSESTSSSSVSATPTGWYEYTSFLPYRNLAKFNEDWTYSGVEYVPNTTLGHYAFYPKANYYYTVKWDVSNSLVKIDYDGSALSTVPFSFTISGFETDCTNVAVNESLGDFYACKGSWIRKYTSGGILDEEINLGGSLNVLGLEFQTFGGFDYLYAFEDSGRVYKLSALTLSSHGFVSPGISSIRDGKYYNGYWWITTQPDMSVRKYTNSASYFPGTLVATYSGVLVGTNRIGRRSH